MTSFLTESNSIHVIFWCVHSTATLTSTSKPSSTPSHWWFWANLNIHFPSMIENNDSVCIIQGKALCCHCCYLKIAWKQQWLSVWQGFSAVPHTFLIVLPTTLLNSVDLVGIVQKVGQWSSRFWENNERAAGASWCLASTMQQVWFYTWAGRFRQGWVMFLSNKQRWPKNEKNFLILYYPFTALIFYYKPFRIRFWTQSSHVEPQQSLKSWNVEFDNKNGRSMSPSQCCGSANWNTQLHNMISHGTITPQTISHFTAPPIGP
jgi:hypothetical protein